MFHYVSPPTYMKLHNNLPQAVEASEADLVSARKRVQELEKAHEAKQEAAAKVCSNSFSHVFITVNSNYILYQYPS